MVDDDINTLPEDESTSEALVWYEPSVQRQELYQWRMQLAQMRGSQKLQAILNAPVPQLLVQSMPPQELLCTCKDIGLADCAEVVELTHKEQLRSALDLDVWKKDQIEYENIHTWLKFLEAGEIGAAEKVLAALDPDVFALYFRQFLRIHVRIEDEDEPYIETEGELLLSPDRNYIVEIPFPPEDPKFPMLQAAVHLFFQYGYEFNHQLFETIRCSLDSDLEERAYQFRKSRIEEQGYIDYFDAIGIYQPLPVKAKPMPPLPLKDDMSWVPILAVPRTSGLFHQTLQQIRDPRILERIQAELVYLNNKVLAAEQIDPGQRQAMERNMRVVLRTLDLGLEILLFSGSHDAVEILHHHHMEWIFRNGFSALARLRKKARQIAHDPRLTLVSSTPFSLLGSPYAEFLQELQQLTPRFFNAFDTPPGHTARPFRQLHDIHRAEHILATVSSFADLFFVDFGFSHEALLELAASQTLLAPAQPEDIHFSHLFLTALAQFVLSGEFVLRPLRNHEIHQFLQTMFVPQNPPPHVLQPDWHNRIETLLLQHPSFHAESAAIQQFLREIWERLLTEAAYLPLDEKPEAQFLNLFLVLP